MKMPSERTRAWLYQILAVGIAIAGTYGLIDDQQQVLLLSLIAAVLGLGLARANTTTKQ